MLDSRGKYSTLPPFWLHFSKPSAVQRYADNLCPDQHSHLRTVISVLLSAHTSELNTVDRTGMSVSAGGFVPSLFVNTIRPFLNIAHNLYLLK